MSNRLDQPGDTDAGSDDHARTRARDVARSEGVSNLQALQRVLCRSAKQDPTRRFHALYDKLTRSDVMWQAWINVATNQGAPGVDGVSIDSIEAGGMEGVTSFLDELAAEVRDETYRPQPLRRVHIPKAGKPGESRPLGIPALRDRVLMSAAKLILEPIFEADFSPNSFGFRPKRSAHGALEAIRESASSGAHWVLDADIKSCFDEIDHDALMVLIERRVSDRAMLKLLRSWLRAGIIEGGVYSDVGSGTPQGSPISPLLCNIALSVLDEDLARARTQTGKHIRYADDWVTRTQGGIDVEDRTRQVMLCQRWGLAPRDRPAGGGLKPPQAASVKSRGGERCGKGAPRVRQVRAEKANESKPLMTCRKRIDDIKTGRESFSRDEPGGYLPTAQAVSGIKAARAQFRLWCGTCEPVAPIPIRPFIWACAATRPARGRTPSRRNGKGQSTVAEHRDGPTRSSDEGPVMGPERRGRVIRTRLVVNHRLVG